jgi:hypothetical protein
MKHFLIGVYQVCSNKSPWVKIGPVLGAYLQVSDFRAIMALLFKYQSGQVVSWSSYLDKKSQLCVINSSWDAVSRSDALFHNKKILKYLV